MYVCVCVCQLGTCGLVMLYYSPLTGQRKNQMLNRQGGWPGSWGLAERPAAGGAEELWGAGGSGRVENMHVTGAGVGG